MVQAITPSSCDSSSTRTVLFFDFFCLFCFFFQIDVKLWKEMAPTVCWFPRASVQKDQWSERDGEEAKQDHGQSKGRWIEGDAGDNERSWRKPIDSDKRIEREREERETQITIQRNKDKGRDKREEGVGQAEETETKRARLPDPLRHYQVHTDFAFNLICLIRNCLQTT